jgi:hypothetical protein
LTTQPSRLDSGNAHSTGWPGSVPVSCGARARQSRSTHTEKKTKLVCGERAGNLENECPSLTPRPAKTLVNPTFSLFSSFFCANQISVTDHLRRWNRRSCREKSQGGDVATVKRVSWVEYDHRSAIDLRKTYCVVVAAEVWTKCDVYHCILFSDLVYPPLMILSVHP